MTLPHRTTADRYEALAEELDSRGVDVTATVAALREQSIETPSWAYSRAGTRFAVHEPAGAARDVLERIEDAGAVQRHVGIAPSVAVHIPWDRADPDELLAHAAAHGVRIGAVNPNLFEDPAYRLGSVCHPDPGVRAMAVEHLLECARLAGAYGSDAISLWLADGTSYPGQDDLLARRARLIECLHTLCSALPAGVDLLVEYKPYEPAFYATDIADWGSALLICRELGPRAKVLVDLGHHLQGTNIEQIVALLLGERRLGGFHFNNRKYGDDDLIVGSVNPFELFLIYVELAGAPEPVRQSLDQAHIVESKLEAVLLSVMNLQEAYAKALIVDRAALAEAQRAGDVVAAHRVLLDAYATDVRPLCAQIRVELGGAADPIEALRASGYAARAARARSAQLHTTEE
jgi:L-rhamnose isomerase / sugar isomerase